LLKYLDVSKNRGTPKSSILIGCPFWGIPIFGNTHMGICWSHLRDVVEMILSWADSLIVMSCDERRTNKVELPGTQMTSIFEGQPPKTRPFPIKTGVIWVPGIYPFNFHNTRNLRRWRCHSDFQKFMRTQQAISGQYLFMSRVCWGFCSLLCDCKISMKSGLNHQQVIQAVTFLSPIWRSLNLWRGHLTIPKRSPAELPGIW